jgi:hypothetical protein
MDDGMKKGLRWLMIIVGLLIVAYGAYRLYYYTLEFVTQRVEKRAAQEVRKEIGGAVNPLKELTKLIP